MNKEQLKAYLVGNIPFTPNFQQDELLDWLVRFVLTDRQEAMFLLQGYAGTGKTSIVGALVKTLTQLGRKCVLLAPTGRAAKVFAGYSGHPAFTIHKKIYRQRRFSAEMEGFQTADNLMKHTLFIVDEASMISNSSEGSAFGTGHLLDDLVEYVYAGEGCRLLVMGDVGQLPPVGQTESPALQPATYRSMGLAVGACQLTEVARQAADSGILLNATRLREVMAQGEPYGLPHLIVEGLKDVRRIYGMELIEEIESAYQRDGLEETIIITRSNKRAIQFNNGVRNQVLDRESELEAGDRLLIAKNNYHWGREVKGLDFIANGDIVEVKRVRRTQELYGFRFADVEVIFPDYDYEVEVKVLLDTLQSEAPALTAQQQQRLFEEVWLDYEEIPTQRERMKAVKVDPFFNALQVKYAYGVTCHKAQGGQWKNVFLDMAFISAEHLGLDFYRWHYTAFTRATERVFLVNISDELIEGGE